MRNQVFARAIFSLATVVLLSLLAAPIAYGKPSNGQELGIRLTDLSASKTITLSDSITLEFTVINSGSSPVGIFTQLGMGYQGGVILHVLRQDGSEIQKPILFHDTLLESDVMNKNNYTQLIPDHFIGMQQTFKVSELVTKPGHYKLLAEYHSPIETKYAQIENFFGIERKSIVSNQVVLIVRP